MPLLGGVKCDICGKTGKQKEFIYDPNTGKYFCCEEHRIKAEQLKALMEKALEKGLVLCSNCLKEIKSDAFVCKYCGSIRVSISGYEKGKMCPFTVGQIGKTEFGHGEYTWKHMECIREYCALWDFNSDKCSFLTRFH